jgi:hypothetical protein
MVYEVLLERDAVPRPDEPVRKRPEPRRQAVDMPPFRNQPGQPGVGAGAALFRRGRQGEPREARGHRVGGGKVDAVVKFDYRQLRSGVAWHGRLLPPRT